LKKHVLGVFLFGLIVCLTGVSAHAQSTGKISLFGGYSYMTNSWGNGCEAACLGGITTGLHGYTLSGVYAFNSHLGIEANFAGHNGSPTIFSEPVTTTSNGEVETENQDFYTYTFGPKLTLPVGNFDLFTHFLVGGAHGHETFIDKCLQSTGSESTCFTTDTSDAHGNGFAFKTGGGVDWSHGRLGVRILEVDYIHAATFVTKICGGCTQSDSFGITANNFELATGVTFNFDMK
jgi:hypothetical protein